METIKIKNFYGCNYKIEIKDRFLIIIGDNGERKSTLLRFIFFLITKQFEKISEFDFEEVTVDLIRDSFTFNKNNYLLERDKVYTHSSLKLKIENKFSDYKKLIDRIFVYYKIENLLKNESLIEEIEFKEDVPKQLLLSIRSSIEESVTQDSGYSSARVYDSLYLPTYRRIEKDYKTLFGDIDKRLYDYLRDLIELKKDTRINYISDISYNENTKTELKNHDRNFTDDLELTELTFDDSLFDTEDSENSIIEIQDHSIEVDKHIKYIPEQDELNKENIIGNLFSKLMDERNRERWSKNHDSSFTLEMIDFGIDDVIQRILEFQQKNGKNDKLIHSTFESFQLIISRYIRNFDLKINANNLLITKNGHLISDINSLSSGEKQIISIFSYLIFEKKKDKVVIIDEPEISLSLKWQEMFLEDVRKLCDLLIVATHSPFIVKENYFKNTKSIKDFLLIED
jgi:energy-coupling factor transporter ATP-binding protein EcfA2